MQNHPVHGNAKKTRIKRDAREVLYATSDVEGVAAMAMGLLAERILQAFMSVAFWFSPSIRPRCRRFPIPVDDAAFRSD